MARFDDYIEQVNKAETATDIAAAFSAVTSQPDARAIADAIEGRFVKSFRENFIKLGEEIDTYVALDAVRNDKQMAQILLEADNPFGRSFITFDMGSVKVAGIASGIAAIKGDAADPLVKTVVRAFDSVTADESLTLGGKLRVLELIAAELGAVHKPENAQAVSQSRAEQVAAKAVLDLLEDAGNLKKFEAMTANFAALSDASKAKMVNTLEGAFVQVSSGLFEDRGLYLAISGILDTIDKMPPEIKTLYKSQIDVQNPEFQDLMGGFLNLAKLSLLIEDIKGESKVPLIRAFVSEFSKLSDEEYNDPFEQMRAISKAITKADKEETARRKPEPPQNPFRNKGPK